jgi:hypothetical protein
MFTIRTRFYTRLDPSCSCQELPIIDKLKNTDLCLSSPLLIYIMTGAFKCSGKARIEGCLKDVTELYQGVVYGQSP